MLTLRRTADKEMFLTQGGENRLAKGTANEKTRSLFDGEKNKMELVL